MSDTCVTTHNKTNTDYKCCKGEDSTGAYTVFQYCVDTTKENFVNDGVTYNYDCRLSGGASTLAASAIAVLGAYVTLA